jgi:hypothetical protein
MYLRANCKQTFLRGFCNISCWIICRELDWRAESESVVEEETQTESEADSKEGEDEGEGGVGEEGEEEEEGRRMWSMMPMHAARLPASTITVSSRENDTAEGKE